MDVMRQNSLKESVAENSAKMLQEFEDLTFPLMGRLYSTALTMTRDKLDAEDLVQETYMKAWRYFDKFEVRRNFRSWIFRILTNNFINVCRTKKLQPLQSNFETTCATFADEDPKEIDKNNAASLCVNYQELFDDSITAALEQLPEHYRMVVLLCDVSDLKYNEIAEVLNCPIGTVMSRIHRGRQMLAKSLKQDAEANGYVVHSKL